MSADTSSAATTPSSQQAHTREPALEPDAHGAHFKVVAVGKYFFHFGRRDRHVKFRLRARMRRIIPAAMKAVRLHIA